MSVRTWVTRATSPDPPAVRLARLREVRVRDLAVRAAFGGVISLVAGVLSDAFGPRFGGMFLAFPAILPASVTLVEQHEHRSKARDAARGSVFGAVALVAFALAAWPCFAHGASVAALLVATLAWTAVGFGLYFAVRRLARSTRRSTRDEHETAEGLRRRSARYAEGRRGRPGTCFPPSPTAFAGPAVFSCARRGAHRRFSAFLTG